MSDPVGGATPQQGAAPNGLPPQLTINAQYIKDLSFENPNAPQSLLPDENRPQIEVNVDVQARGVGTNVYEVAIRIVSTARRDQAVLFVIELVYAGLFTLQNIPAEQLEPVCLIECPRLIFPFARRIIADATRDGGFPPLLLDPIDFVDLFRRHRAGEAPGAGTAQA